MKTATIKRVSFPFEPHLKWGLVVGKCETFGEEFFGVYETKKEALAEAKEYGYKVVGG